MLLVMKVSALMIFTSIISFVHLQAQTADLKSINFKKADSIAALYPNHSLRDLRNLAEKLATPLSTDTEKFRAIYKWVCNNIDNDYVLYQKNKRNREKHKDPEERKEWNKKFHVRVFKTLLESHRTVCTGYAYLIKELAFHAGLKAVIIDGYGRTSQSNIRGSGVANHSWNAVQLDGNWHLCDATWSSGAVDATLSKFVRNFNDCYFLADPALFVRNHYPLDSSWMLLSKKPTLYNFLNRPLIYYGIYDYKIDQLFPETFDIVAVKGKTISFQFSKKATKQYKRLN
jgi:transglutaminase/protease-like cytokinesis protein 3